MMSMHEWLEKALHKIDTMPREEFINSLERAGVVLSEKDPMQELVELTEELGLYDETK